MSDGNASAGKEPPPLRRGDSGDPGAPSEQLPSVTMDSPGPELEGNNSPRSRTAILSDDGSMASNRAQHPASLSYSNMRAGSGELPDDYAMSAVSDQAAESVPSNQRQQGSPQPRKAPPRHRSGTSRSRPISRSAVDNWAGRAVTAGGESRLRYSVNSTDDPDAGDSGPIRFQQQQQFFRMSPISNDERFSASASPRPDEMGVSRTSGESTEDSGNDQTSTGGSYEVDGEEQLTNNVRGIYAGIVMVEERCREYIKIQSQPGKELSPQHWQQLIAVHRTLLQEHHDFLLATQNPVGHPGLKSSAQKYSMPARLWRHGIQALLELLRRRLPGSSEFMLTFIHLAYSMMTLLLETAPAFEDIWIECLGDIARYRMLVEEADFREQEVWVRIARYWYNEAADKNPDVGRIQHHLAVLGRPDIVQQLFYYTKSLVCNRPFDGARESIFLIFNPSLQGARPTRHLPEVITAFVAAHSYLFTGELSGQFTSTCDNFLLSLSQYATRMGPAFKVHGAYIVSCNFAAILEYAAPNAFLPDEFRRSTTQTKTVEDIYPWSHRYWTPVSDIRTIESDFLAARDSKTISPLVFHGSCLAFQTLSVLLGQVGNKNMLPSLHTSLAFLWCLARTSSGIKHIEVAVPWAQIVGFLNTLIRDFTDFALIEGPDFPIQKEDRWLPEDFLIRGQVWSQRLYPAGFFTGAPNADEGRNLEPPSRDLSRMHRCLWLGVRLAKFNRWMTYDWTTQRFSATGFVRKLDELAQQHSPFYGKGLQMPGNDVEMHNS
ncbi:hypothetical protein BJY01DRAFT_23733 [Aspergillus pseudoustus]|uniref:DNA/RNA-binding domain-containing protein n=1 Tax=Aspergillus pseudoustus TaxID=1810923 RepID=A0ABR4JIP8_9EURO